MSEGLTQCGELIAAHSLAQLATEPGFARFELGDEFLATQWAARFDRSRRSLGQPGRHRRLIQTVIFVAVVPEVTDDL
ncbi:MAG: hypothetical protein ACRDTG_09270 [Pseudonocardiaceae bacterium]